MRKPLPSRVREREGRAETSRTPGRLTRARPARARRVLVRYRVRAARRHARPRVGSRGRAVPSRSVGRRTSTGKRYPRPIDGEGWQVHERWKRKIYAHRPVGRSRPVWCRAKPRPGKTDGERGGAGGLGARTREALKPPRPRRVACQGETKRVAFRQMIECGSLVKPTHVTDACTSGPSMYEAGTILV